MEKNRRTAPRRSDNSGRSLSFLLWLVGGTACGIIWIRALPSPQFSLLFRVMLTYVCIFVGIFLQTIIHEAGHLVFGLLSGYGFSSFRVGSLVLVKTPEGLRCKRMKLAGTAGQCLMSPPPPRPDGTIPCILYNLGGCLMNLLVSALLMLLGRAVAGPWRAALLTTAVMGVVGALQNGIPLRLRNLYNDGHNALSLGRDPVACRAFFVQLECNARSVAGERLRDMPEALFQLPPEADMDNPLVVSARVFAAQRILDQGDWRAALMAMEPLRNLPGIPGIYRPLLRCDCAVCALLLDQTEPAVAWLDDPEQKRLMKAMKNSPSVLRTEYALALLGNGDETRARTLRAQFETAAARYPTPGDVASERALMAEIDQYWQEKTYALSENRN